MSKFDGDYFFGLIAVFIAFLVLAILTFVWYVLFLCIRCCCGQQCCCQCCQSIAHCLCGGKAKEYYSPNWKKFVYAANIILGVLIFIFVVIGLAGNTKVHDGVSNLTGDIVDTIDDIYNTAEYCYTRVGELYYQEPTVTNSIRDFRDTVQEVRDTGADVREQIIKYDGYRVAAIGVGFGFPLFAILLCVILLWVGMRGSHYLFITLFTFSVIFLWLSLGVHMPLSTLSHDACTEAQHYIDHPEDLADISFIVSCLNNGSYFDTFYNITGAVDDALQSIQDEASQFGITINTTIPQSGGTFEDQVLDMVAFVNDQLQYVTSQVAQLPPENQSSDAVLEINRYVNDSTIYCDIVLNISSLATCDYFVGLLTTAKNHFCGGISDGASGIVTGDWGTVIVFLIAAYFVMALYNIRFPSSSPKALEWQEPIAMGQNEGPALVVVQTQSQSYSPYGTVPTTSPTSSSIAFEEPTPILCHNCQTKFGAPAGTPSGSQVNCPNCHQPNQMP